MVTICILLIIEEFTSLSIEYLFVTLIVFPGLLPIYVPLIYIRAFEGTINAAEWRMDRHKRKRGAFRRPKSTFEMGLSPVIEIQHGGIPTINPLGAVSQEMKPSVIRAAIKGITGNLTLRSAESKRDSECGSNAENEQRRESMIDYLKDESNYKTFVAYLGYCFALENLIFMEKVSVLYQVMRRLRNRAAEIDRANLNTLSTITLSTGTLPIQLDAATLGLAAHSNGSNLTQPASAHSKSMANASTINTVSTISLQMALSALNEPNPSSSMTMNDVMGDMSYVASERIKRMKFEYLGNLYYDLNDKIEQLAVKYNQNERAQDGAHKKNEQKGAMDGDTPRGHDFAYYKRALFRMTLYLYDEHIGYSSSNQVNVSSQTAMELKAIFGRGRDDEATISRFRRFEDFMYVFDAAFLEIYQLTVGIYGHRFQGWLKEQSENHKE